MRSGVLIVVDGVAVRTQLRQAFEDAGLPATACATAASARWALSVTPFDLVALALRLPDGDGLGLVEEIRRTQRNADVPVLLLAEDAELPASRAGPGRGADARVGTPDDAASVVAAARRLLKQSASPHAPPRGADAAAGADGEPDAPELAEARRELKDLAGALSHDLRAPARQVEGYARALLEDCADLLDERGRKHLARLRSAAKRVVELSEDLGRLARVLRAELALEAVDLSAVARRISDQLRDREPSRLAEIAVEEGLTERADARLVEMVLECLLDNAWKFTSTRPRARIEFGRTATASGPAYFVRDDGVGFEMDFAGRIFEPLQRLHGSDEFGGSGMGLALVRHVVRRHGGRAWAESAPDRGTTVYFTLGRGAA